VSSSDRPKHPRARGRDAPTSSVRRFEDVRREVAARSGSWSCASRSPVPRCRRRGRRARRRTAGGAARARHVVDGGALERPPDQDPGRAHLVRRPRSRRPTPAWPRHAGRRSLIVLDELASHRCDAVESPVERPQAVGDEVVLVVAAGHPPVGLQLGQRLAVPFGEVERDPVRLPDRSDPRRAVLGPGERLDGLVDQPLVDRCGAVRSAPARRHGRGGPGPRTRSISLRTHAGGPVRRPRAGPAAPGAPRSPRGAVAVAHRPARSRPIGARAAPGMPASGPGVPDERPVPRGNDGTTAASHRSAAPAAAAPGPPLCGAAAGGVLRPDGGRCVIPDPSHQAARWLAVVARTPPATRRTCVEAAPVKEAASTIEVPAATYSPTGLPRQYHRRWRA
jgi:hypothetical protein